jgi:hypothetical protein
MSRSYISSPPQATPWRVVGLSIAVIFAAAVSIIINVIILQVFDYT